MNAFAPTEQGHLPVWVVIFFLNQLSKHLSEIPPVSKRLDFKKARCFGAKTVLQRLSADRRHDRIHQLNEYTEHDEIISCSTLNHVMRETSCCLFLKRVKLVLLKRSSHFKIYRWLSYFEQMVS